jgi:serine/threonine protein kinase
VSDKSTRLLELAGRLARRLHRDGEVDPAALAAEHDSRELQPALARVLEMLEVWLRLGRAGAEQNPREFAARSGAEEEIQSALLEAVATWRLCASASASASSEAQAPSGPGSSLPGEEVEGRRMVTGHSLVAVRNWTEGGPNVVGEGNDVILNRPVAVKTPRNPDYPRFAQEIELTGSFVHPHIVPVFSLAFDKEGKPAFIMPLISGGTLTAAINRHYQGHDTAERRRSLHRLLQHVVTAARTLHYAHTRKPAVIHRDVKPDNLLLDESGNLYVADWGHGYRADHLEEGAAGFGTRSYSAPEQWNGTPPSIRIEVQRVLNALRTSYGERKLYQAIEKLQAGHALPEACEAVGVDFRELLGRAGIDLVEELARPGRAADVYSLGATLYHAVTGQPPFGEACSEADRQANRFPPPERPACRSLVLVGRGCDAELAGIIKKAMATDPEARYGSASEFADDLERVMGRLVDEPTRAFRPGEEPFGVRLRRGIRRRAGMVATLLVLFGLAGMVGWSCSAERHYAVLTEQGRAKTELQQSRRKSEQDLKAEKEEAGLQIREAQEKAGADIQSAHNTAEQRLQEVRDKARRDLEAQQEQTRKAEAEVERLRRSLSRAEFRSELREQLHQAHTAPRRPLSPQPRRPRRRGPVRPPGRGGPGGRGGRAAQHQPARVAGAVEPLAPRGRLASHHPTGGSNTRAA